MNIKQDFIPKGRKNRPGYPMTAKFITLHDTGNKAATADAANHAKYLKGDTAANTPVSWHFTVDDKQIIQHMPITESGWHAGDGSTGSGNRQSIGIEMCEHAGVDRVKVEANAAWLVAHLLKATNLPISAVVQHNRWSGKDCPKSLRSKPNGWNVFIQCVQAELKASDPLPQETKPEKPVSHSTFKDVPDDHWAIASIRKAKDIKLVVGKTDGTLGLGEGVTIERLLVILGRLGLLDKEVK